MEQMTPKQLLLVVKKLIAQGYGDYPIIISDDNEGNAYHGMFFGATLASECVDADQIYDSQETDPSKCVVLG